MYWQNNVTGHLSPPVWNILGWNCLGFAFKPPGLVFVGPSANSTNSRPSSPFMILKSSILIPWCSCLPQRPNYWVSSHHIVWIKDSEVLPPSFSLFQIISSSSSDNCWALFGRLPQPAKRSCFAFPSSTCLEELNSLSWTMDRLYDLSFWVSVKWCNHNFQAFWFVILTMFVFKFSIESLEQSVELRRLVIFNFLGNSLLQTPLFPHWQPKSSAFHSVFVFRAIFQLSCCCRGG